MSPNKITISSVTNFLHHKNDYLFVKRKATASINPNELNGIGGKLEPMEDYVTAAIRETREETGYVIAPSAIRFCGTIKFEEGYKEKWITCFFKIKVPSKKIPLGNKTREGELMWLNKGKVLNSGHKLVDDINYIFKDIVNESKLFFMTVKVNKVGEITEQTNQKLQL